MWKIRNITNGSIWTGEAWTPFPQNFVEMGVVTLDDTYEMVRMQDTRKVPGVFNVGDRVRYMDIDIVSKFYRKQEGIVIEVEGSGRCPRIKMDMDKSSIWCSLVACLEHVKDT